MPWRQLGFIGRAWQCDLELYAARSFLGDHSGRAICLKFGGLPGKIQATYTGENVRFGCNCSSNGCRNTEAQCFAFSNQARRYRGIFSTSQPRHIRHSTSSQYQDPTE